ncbi:MAG: phosphotyrosine protein phosphatase [Ahniella sp.]|nr:phosphotyrosine protein phosphatase [Ahniella sp.]
MSLNVLFICTQNRLRSPTAEHVFADWPGVETQSAGLGHEATSPVSPELLAWSDLIFVMEKSHRGKLSKKFKRYLGGKRVICLDIRDDYAYMDPLLVALLKQRVPKFLPSGPRSSEPMNDQTGR